MALNEELLIAHIHGKKDHGKIDWSGDRIGGSLVYCNILN